MQRQIELAKNYGIYGFCFHYYWFSGKRLMEKPIFNYLNNKDLKFPFCLCWADENWSRKWNGGNEELLMEQNLTRNDFKRFFDDIIPFLLDERYIKIDGKPLLIIYRTDLFGEEIIKDFIDFMKSESKNAGLPGLYVVMAKTFGNENNPKKYHMDAAVEFPPHNMSHIIQKLQIKKYIIPKFVGNIYNISKYIKDKLFLYSTNYTLFKTVFPNWDNTARRPFASSIYQMSAQDYKTWLYECIKWVKENNKDDEQLVFINAWNEWAEGAHLEPDMYNGYAYLESTIEALEHSSRNV